MQRIQYLEKQLKAVEKNMQDVLDKVPLVRQKVNIIISIPDIQKM